MKRRSFLKALIGLAPIASALTALPLMPASITGGFVVMIAIVEVAACWTDGTWSILDRVKVAPYDDEDDLLELAVANIRAKHGDNDPLIPAVHYFLYAAALDDPDDDEEYPDPPLL